MNYKVDDVKSVLDPWLSVLDRKIEPVIVSVCICVVLDKKCVRVGLFFMLKGAE